MNKYFFLFVTLIFLTCSFNTIHNKSIQSSFVLIYKLTYKIDSLNDDKNTELMQLTVKDNISLFESQFSHKADSILDSPSFDQSSMNLLSNYLKSNFTYKIYKTHPNNEIKYYDKIGNKTYHIDQNNKIVKWQITSVTKKIAEYSCRRATTSFAGRQWEAWFTTAIPLSEGPYKFSGLPGLIISLHDNDNDYSFDLIKISNTSNIIKLKLPENIISTNQKEFNQGKITYNLQGVTKVANNGNSPEVARQLIRNYQQKQARKNNPLELR
ncbi:GLPGLI family protein [Hymenobacter sp. UYP22]|uniref:GLPGLI family protein n=1 Tax=Hymenobacter sp. UYP22 TaxID=3156348 RepID=UPI0033996BB0